MKTKIKYYSLIFTLISITAVTVLLAHAQSDSKEDNYILIDHNYNFSIKYPADYVVIKQKDGYTRIMNKSVKNMDGDQSSILIVVRENKNNSDIQNWFIQNPKYYIGDRTFDQVKYSKLSLDKINDREMSSITYEGMGELKSSVLKLDDNHILEITAHTLSSFEKDKNLSDAYNYIINNI